MIKNDVSYYVNYHWYTRARYYRAHKDQLDFLNYIKINSSAISLENYKIHLDKSIIELSCKYLAILSLIGFVKHHGVDTLPILCGDATNQ